MAYRVYYEYPKIAKGHWFPILEQREFLEDALRDAWSIRHMSLAGKIGINVEIRKEPAELTEMYERKILSKLGMKKQSTLRGLIEGALNPIW